MVQQLDRPCVGCPFARENNLEGSKPGGADPRVYVGQAYGPFLLPCHMDPKYEQDKRSTELVQCAGAAIFRANVGRAGLMPPEMLHLPADAELVFANANEMVAHYFGITLAEAETLMKRTPPLWLMHHELRQQGCQFLERDRIKLRGGRDGGNG
jgi:hypothetical protein